MTDRLQETMTDPLREALERHFGPTYQDAIEAVIHDVTAHRAVPEAGSREHFRNNPCPNCGSILIVSPDQSPCEAQNEPNHGDQTWWTCPECNADWEDEEL